MRPGPLRSLTTRAATSCSLIALAFGCAAGPERPALPVGADRTQLRKTLEASIARDRAQLAELVTIPRDGNREPLYEDATLQTLAERITRDSARLAELRDEPAP